MPAVFDACHRRRLRSKLQRYWYAIDSIIRVFEFWLRHLFVWGSLEEKAAAYGGRFSDAPRQMRWVRQQLNGPLGPPSPARWKSATARRRGRHRWRHGAGHSPCSEWTSFHWPSAPCASLIRRIELVRLRSTVRERGPFFNLPLACVEGV